LGLSDRKGVPVPITDRDRGAGEIQGVFKETCHSEMRDEGAGRALVATGFFRIRNLNQLTGAN
jgi:hypothetical protein